MKSIKQGHLIFFVPFEKEIPSPYKLESERERQRQRDREGQRQRDRDRDRQKKRERDRQTDRAKERRLKLQYFGFFSMGWKVNKFNRLRAKET